MTSELKMTGPGQGSNSQGGKDTRKAAKLEQKPWKCKSFGLRHLSSECRAVVRSQYRTQGGYRNTPLLFKDSPSTGGRSQLSRLEGHASPMTSMSSSLSSLAVESDGVFSVDWPSITKDRCGGTYEIQGGH